MADKFTHMSSFPVKLVDNGDDTYSLNVTLAGGAITTLSSGTLTELLHVTTISNIDTVSKVLSIDTLSTIESVQTVNSLVTVTEISNISSVDTIDIVNSIQTITELSNVSSVDTVDVISSVITITEVTNISNLEQGTITATQVTHDNLNCNANIQVANADVSSSNPVPIDVKEIIDSSMGIYGGNYITTTATTTPSTGYTFFAIQAITDTVVSSVTGNIDVSSIQLSAGYTIYGAWTAIKLTSGSVIAYKRVT